MLNDAQLCLLDKYCCWLKRKTLVAAKSLKFTRMWLWPSSPIHTSGSGQFHMTNLQGNPTAGNPGIIMCSKGAICPNLRHVEATLYPQAGNFYLWFFHLETDLCTKFSTWSCSLSFSKVLKRCEHRMWSAESVSGKWEMVKTTENSSVCLKFDSCLTCLLQRADWRTRWYVSEELRPSSLCNKKYCWFPSECLRSYCKICPTLAAPLKVWALSRSRLSNVSMVRDRLISRKFRNEEF